MDLLDTQLYGLIGAEGFTQLAAAFFRRVAVDDVLSHIYPKEDLAGAEERLRGFLIQRFGGPDDYSQKRGHPRLRMRHAPYAIDRRGRDRWVERMEEAMAEVKLAPNVVQMLRPFFNDSATFMINRPG